MNTPAAGTHHWVSIADAAEYAGLTERTIRKYMYEGRLPYARCGKKTVRIDLADIDTYVIVPEQPRRAYLDSLR
jgi:excisionase family DNA binding protein